MVLSQQAQNTQSGQSQFKWSKHVQEPPKKPEHADGKQDEPVDVWNVGWAEEWRVSRKSAKLIADHKVHIHMNIENSSFIKNLPWWHDGFEEEPGLHEVSKSDGNLEAYDLEVWPDFMLLFPPGKSRLLATASASCRRLIPIRPGELVRMGCCREHLDLGRVRLCLCITPQSHRVGDCLLLLRYNGRLDRLYIHRTYVPKSRTASKHDPA